MKVCAEPGCPTLTKGTRCPGHTRARDKARGTRQQRGYDSTYDAKRRGIQMLMDAGVTYWCWRCPELDKPAHKVDPKAWHLGHDNEDRSVIRGPQCPASNLMTSKSRISPRA